MANRGKQFKALSPKKVSRRKRTPRCDSCGKRDGEDAGGEGQAKIRLKLCARCRAVAYCGMECQKAGWKAHREVCVHYAAAELPPPSPLVNHQKISSGTGQRGGSRRKVIYGGAVGTVGATPRQREHAPTRHPFFGRQNSIESERRATVGNPQSKAPREGQRQQRQQPQQQQQQQQQSEDARRRSPQTTQPASEEESCPSPPMMQRLSYPGSGRSRQGSKSGGSSGGGVDAKRPSPASKSPSETQQARQSPGAAVAAAVKMAASRARRRTHNLTKGRRAYGSLSPPPPPPGAKEVERRRSGSGPVRRESAPLYPAALEKTKRLAARKDASLAADATRRGPPPPYSSVAHRADSARKPPPSTSPKDDKPAAAAPPRRSSSTADVRQTTRIPPPLPPRPSVSLGENPRGSSLSPGLAAGGTSTGSPPQVAPENKGGGGQPAGEHEPKAGKGVEAPRESEVENEKPQGWRSGGGGGAEIDALEVPKEGEGGGTQAAREGEEEEDTEGTEEPTPEPRAGDDAQARDADGAPEWVVPPSVTKDRSQDSAAGSPRAREDDNAAPVQPALTKGAAQELSQDPSAGSVLGREGDTALSKDSAAVSSRDSAAGSPRAREESVVPVQPVLTKGSVHELSQDSAAGSVLGREGDATLAKDSAAGSSRDSAAGSPRPREEDDVVRVQRGLTKGSEHNFSQDSLAGSVLGREGGTAATGSSRDSAAGSPPPQEEDNLVPARPAMAKGSAGTVSQDSAAGSSSGQEGDAAVVPRRPSLAPCSVDSLSQDSAAGSTTAQENHQAPALPLPMGPPPPIQTSSKTGASGLVDTGVFDSCPPSTGVSSPEPGSHRSLSVGTAPQFLSMPLMLAAREKASAAVAAWQKDRRSSPRPRPPVSPGPAALSQSSPLKSAFRFRKPSAASEHDEGPERTPPSSATFGAGAGRKLSAPPLSRTFSALSSAASHASPGSARTSATMRPPFVPAIELSPRASLPASSHAPGPRTTDTATFYRERTDAAAAAAAGDVGLLPPASKAYFGRPSGFSVHVLVASALSAADLASPPSQQQQQQQQHLEGGGNNNPRLYYSFEDRGRVAEALRPGDVVLVTPGRYEARAWGLQRLVSSVEIVGAGDAGDCVLYNEPASSGPAGEHYLVGVMGGALGSAGGGGASVPEVKGKDVVADDDDSDSGFEDGALGNANSSVHSFSGRAVRVRLANLTLEQGSGYRGAVYQLGRESHLEMDGCTVVGSKGGVNIDQGTCIICDSWISGSEVFGVHIGGEGAVEHCSISGCGGGGRGGGGGGGKYLSSSTVGNAEDEDDEDDDGTDVNRVGGMPAISILQSSRVRVRFNVIRDNAGHTLQCRDAPLPGGDGKYALLARRAEAEAEE
ncbi:unnamed protein product, partial [Ectocarpus fasciculatus]